MVGFATTNVQSLRTARNGRIYALVEVWGTPIMELDLCGAIEARPGTPPLTRLTLCLDDLFPIDCVHAKTLNLTYCGARFLFANVCLACCGTELCRAGKEFYAGALRHFVNAMGAFIARIEARTLDTPGTTRFEHGCPVPEAITGWERIEGELHRYGLDAEPLDELDRRQLLFESSGRVATAQHDAAFRAALHRAFTSNDARQFQLARVQALRGDWLGRGKALVRHVRMSDEAFLRYRIPLDFSSFEAPLKDSLPARLPEGFRETPLCVLKLPSALVSRTGAVISAGRILIEDVRHFPGNWNAGGASDPGLVENIGIEGYNPHTRHGFARDGEAFDTLPDNQPYFLFNSNIGCLNFGHLVHDTASQILLYDAVAQHHGTPVEPIFRSAFTYPAQSWLMARLLGRSEDRPFRFHYAKRSILVKNLYVPCSVFQPQLRAISTAAFSYLKHRVDGFVRSATGASRNAPGSRIHVSRDDGLRRDTAATMRSYGNFADVERRLADAGFIRVTLSGLQPAEIIEMFAHCDAVAGVHGAGLMNLVFSQRRGTLVEIMGYPRSWESIATVAHTLGWDVARVKSRRPDDRGLAQVDLGELEFALDAIDRPCSEGASSR